MSNYLKFPFDNSDISKPTSMSIPYSVARLMTGHRIERDFESLGEEWYHSNASSYATHRRKQKGDLTDKTLKSAKKPEKIDGKPGRNKN